MLKRLIVAGLLVASSVTVVAAQDIAGTYTVTGKNPDGSDYNGTATIGGTAGGNCGITWTIGNGQASQAFCMRQDDVVSAAYTLGELDRIGDLPDQRRGRARRHVVNRRPGRGWRGASGAAAVRASHRCG